MKDIKHGKGCRYSLADGPDDFCKDCDCELNYEEGIKMTIEERYNELASDTLKEFKELMNRAISAPNPKIIFLEMDRLCLLAPDAFKILNNQNSMIGNIMYQLNEFSEAHEKLEKKKDYLLHVLGEFIDYRKEGK
jgi:hypothetical protein